MPTSPRLIRSLRVIFEFFRAATILLLIAYAFTFFMSPYFPRQYRQSGVLTVNLERASLPMRITQAGKPTHVALERATGSLGITEGSPNDGFARITRSSIFVANSFHAVFLFALFHFLWLLFRNFEKREIFSDRNLVLVRRLGLSLLAYATSGLVVDTWKGWRIGRYVADNFTFEGLKAFTPSAHTGGFPEFFDSLVHYGSFDVTMCLTGLGVLVLAEVFRQGLALKRDVDLTV